MERRGNCAIAPHLLAMNEDEFFLTLTTFEGERESFQVAGIYILPSYGFKAFRHGIIPLNDPPPVIEPEENSAAMTEEGSPDEAMTLPSDEGIKTEIIMAPEMITGDAQ